MNYSRIYLFVCAGIALCLAAGGKLEEMPKPAGGKIRVETRVVRTPEMPMPAGTLTLAAHLTEQ